jgi:hypothetical protein
MKIFVYPYFIGSIITAFSLIIFLIAGSSVSKSSKKKKKNIDL